MTQANGTTNFPNLGLVQNFKFTCDVTVMYTNGSIHGVCFPDSEFFYFGLVFATFHHLSAEKYAVEAMATSGTKLQFMILLDNVRA